MVSSNFFVNNSLANTFIQELYIGFNWKNSPFEEVILNTARYGNVNHSYLITISIVENGNSQSDIFKYERDFNNEMPPNPIKMEGIGKYKGVDCYAVVMWNAISDPSLSDESGMVFFGAMVNREAATLLDNSRVIKEFIYYHALDELTHEAVAHCKFIREDVPFPTIMGEPESTDSNSFIQTIIQNNNVVINLTSDIVVYKDNNSLYGQTEYNNQVIKTFIAVR